MIFVKIHILGFPLFWPKMDENGLLCKIATISELIISQNVSVSFDLIYQGILRHLENLSFGTLIYEKYGKKTSLCPLVS